jgi:hypothetical protein
VTSHMTENEDGTVTYGDSSPEAVKSQLDRALTTERERGTAPGEHQGAQPEPLERFGSLSGLAKLEAEAQKVITNHIEIPIPGDYRAGWSFVVNAIITGDQMERYTNQSKYKSGPDEGEVNGTQLNARVLINHVTEIRENGEAIRNDQGKLVKLNSPEFIKTMQADTAIAALRKFLWDSTIGHLTEHVMDAAGYSRKGSNYVQVKRVDPTQG